MSSPGSKTESMREDFFLLSDHEYTNPYQSSAMDTSPHMFSTYFWASFWAVGKTLWIHAEIWRLENPIGHVTYYAIQTFVPNSLDNAEICISCSVHTCEWHSSRSVNESPWKYELVPIFRDEYKLTHVPNLVEKCMAVHVNNCQSSAWGQKLTFWIWQHLLDLDFRWFGYIQGGLILSHIFYQLQYPRQ